MFTHTYVYTVYRKGISTSIFIYIPFLQYFFYLWMNVFSVQGLTFRCFRFNLWFSKNPLNIISKYGWSIFNEELDESCNLERIQNRRRAFTNTREITCSNRIRADQGHVVNNTHGSFRKVAKNSVLVTHLELTIDGEVGILSQANIPRSITTYTTVLKLGMAIHN